MTKILKVASGRVVALLLAALPAVAVSCSGGGGGLPFVATLSIAVCDPSAGPFSVALTNRFLPLPVGRQLVLEGREDGKPNRLTITVLDQVEVVAGVSTRVVEERQTAAGELVEVARNFFTQAGDGTICYFGEDVDIFENGVVVSHQSQWRAGVNGNRPGIIMPAHPKLGDAYQQEDAPGVAEDRARVTVLGQRVIVPAGTFDDTLTTLEDSALESGSETKIYASGVGLVKSADLELTSFQ